MPTGKNIVHTMKAILQQESRSGFADATVIGGLDKFLDANWNQLSHYLKKIETPYSDRSLEDFLTPLKN